jgi:hypothetical protein
MSSVRHLSGNDTTRVRSILIVRCSSGYGGMHLNPVTNPPLQRLDVEKAQGAEMVGRRTGVSLCTVKSWAWYSLDVLRSRAIGRSNLIVRLYITGNEKWNTDPWPVWLVTPISPPWSSTIALAIGNPIPVP